MVFPYILAYENVFIEARSPLAGGFSSLYWIIATSLIQPIQTLPHIAYICIFIRTGTAEYGIKMKVPQPSRPTGAPGLVQDCIV